MERKLASIQKVLSVIQIPNADSIEQITVLGWSLIAKKGEFKVGDLCVFFEIDSILPDGPEWSEFMRPKKFRVKTMKLNSLGVISAGLALPLSILPSVDVAMINPDFGKHVEGDDVTELLGVKKHEVLDDVNLNGTGNVKGKPFPAAIPKTDETRLQSIPWVLEIMAGQEYYITQKYDGCSATYFIDPVTDAFRVASRNLELEENDGIWWRIAHEWNIEAALRTEPAGMVIQGEITGPGVQRNRMGWDKHQFNIFTVYDLKRGEYLGLIDLAAFCVRTGLPMVPTIEAAGNFHYTLEDLMKLSNDGVYLNGFPQEGIVIRPTLSRLHPVLGMLSFKVINENFLLKTGG